MAITKLITAAEVISIAITEANFNPALIKESIIEDCQFDLFYERLGKDFYNELLTQKEAGTLTAANTTILNDFLKKALAHKVHGKIQPFNTYKTTNAGLVYNTTEYTNSAPSKGMNDVMTASDSLAESWLNQAIRYMKDEDNKDNYPTFHTSDDPPTQTGSRVVGGIVFSRKVTDRCSGCDCEDGCSDSCSENCRYR